jgi:hypothetical protein
LAKFTPTETAASDLWWSTRLLLLDLRVPAKKFLDREPTSFYAAAGMDAIGGALQDEVMGDDDISVGHNFTYIPYPKKIYRRRCLFPH